jgi:polar amino acid transport system permease protein
VIYISGYLELLPGLLKGVVVTVKITFLAGILTFIIAFVTGIARLSKIRIIRWIFTIYVEFFRGTSLLVQLFWAYFVLPFFGINLTPMQAGVFVLALSYGAYVSEVVRGSILAIPEGQKEAGIALNMSKNQIMRLIILPQAFLIMLPSFGNYLIELLKGTALVSLVTISDLMFQGMTLKMATLQSTKIFTMVLIIYFILAYPLTLVIRWHEKRLTKGRA